MARSILDGFLIFSIIQSCLFCALIFTKQKRSTPDNILICWLLIFALQCLLIIVKINLPSQLLLEILPVNIVLLYGPIFFFYIRSMTDVKKFLLKDVIWHVLPFIVFLLLSFFLNEYSVFHKIVSFTAVVSGLSYCIVSYGLLKKHRATICDVFSYTEKVNLQWLSNFLAGLVVIWVGVFILVALNKVFNISLSLNWFFLIIPLFITYIGFYGFKQRVVFTDQYVREIEEKSEDKDKLFIEENSIKTEKAAYKKSGLDTRKMEDIYQQLQNIMQAKALYLQPALSLKELASELRLPSHYITQTLNDYADKSFYDFINLYRVEAFKESVGKKENENLSLLGIAFDCGFNSKSSFNRIFKKVTNYSPSEYKKKMTEI